MEPLGVPLLFLEGPLVQEVLELAPLHPLLPLVPRLPLGLPLPLPDRPEVGLAEAVEELAQLT